MLGVFSLLIVCWGLALFLPKTADDWVSIKKPASINQYQVIYCILILILVFFSGMRTVMNDTATYLSTFNNVPSKLSAIAEIKWNLGANPGFEIYRIILKSVGITNGSLFLLITSLFVTTSYVVFLRKYSVDFPITIYLLIASTTYGFTLAAIKQTIAIGIAVWAISALLDGKRRKFVLLTLLASTFHPYILIFLVAPLFIKEVWSKRTVAVLVAVLLAGSVFGPFVEGLLNVTEAIGDEYETEFLLGAGVNIFRLLVYMVVPVLSFIFKAQLKSKNSPAINLIVNFSVISMCFMILASFGGANMFGRMANYFDLFNCLALPVVLAYGMSDKNAKVIKYVAIACYAVFYYTYYAKYSTAWNADYYQHISLIELFSIIFGGN